MTLTGAYGRSDGVVVAVGWDGTIVRFEPVAEPEAAWTVQASGTLAHLTGIAGVENGVLFGLPAAEGEMFAVGWHGTLLHYHPNPDGDPVTSDGRWTLVAGPEGAALVPRERPDPACPDYDGDGIADDGDGDGWAGGAPCVGGASATCDDNCRTTANGPLRPVYDLGSSSGSAPDGCLESGVDGPSLTDHPAQRDDDGDGVGQVCDPDDVAIDAAPRLDTALFSVWARHAAEQLLVVAVGESGALVTYQGPSIAMPVTAPALPVDRAGAWLAQRSLAFRYTDDCDATTPAGELCDGSGRLPPSCPAQCSPLRTTCNCPSDQGQCCDATAALTGAGCADGSCPPVPNTCDGATGTCQVYCPGCFRRLDHTLRGVAGTGDRLLAVGAAGTVLIGDANDPTGVWLAPVCIPMPQPLDARPVYAAASASNGGFHVVGQEGVVFQYPGGGTCPLAPLVPPSADPAVGFLSGALAFDSNRAYAVGDGGVLLSLGGTPSIARLDTATGESFQALARTRSTEGIEQLWLVGASGTIVLGEYY